MSQESGTHWAVVTGGSSGIGRATALVLAKDGWNIALTFRKSKNLALEVAKQIETIGMRAEVFQADFSVRDSATRLVEEVCRRIGVPHSWIQLAGADLLTGEFANCSFDEKVRLALDVDVIGTIETCRAIGERMKSLQRGAIVTIGWDQASTGMEGDSGQIFAAAKGGVESFSRSLAKTLAPEVRVVCIAPGWIKTSWGEGASQEWQDRVLRETPLRRWGTPNDVADAIAFVISEKAKFLTGQTINVNGGVVTS